MYTNGAVWLLASSRWQEEGKAAVKNYHLNDLKLSIKVNDETAVSPFSHVPSSAMTFLHSGHVLYPSLVSIRLVSHAKKHL